MDIRKHPTQPNPCRCKANPWLPKSAPRDRCENGRKTGSGRVGQWERNCLESCWEEERGVKMWGRWGAWDQGRQEERGSLLQLLHASLCELHSSPPGQGMWSGAVLVHGSVMASGWHRLLETGMGGSNTSQCISLPVCAPCARRSVCVSAGSQISGVCRTPCAYFVVQFLKEVIP